MTPLGTSVVAGEDLRGSAGEAHAVAAATGRTLEHTFGLLTISELGRATAAASVAFGEYRATTPPERARFLDAIADEIESDRPAIVDRAVAESGLPEGRIVGEAARTTGQLRLFADVVRQGDHLGARLDRPLPDRQPPRPDLRTRMVPLGPVAVFGASNFPLAFSTAGGDTASALAAGCPVVVKGHPAHPATGELVARAVGRAVTKCGLPPGVFSFVLGDGNEFGAALVADPKIRAVAFTGSRAGGLALAAVAAARAVPIPVYAEMSSVNPVFVLPGALGSSETTDGLATDFVTSLNLGAGQFCTNPGLLFLPSGDAGDAFVETAAARVQQTCGQTMLTTPIANAYAEGVDRFRAMAGTRVVAEGRPGGAGAPAPALVVADEPVPENALGEVFGACSVIIRYEDGEALASRIVSLEGQLTASVHCAEGDSELAGRLLPILEQRVGRIVFNGWPTGVEVGHSMVHGGPFPATTDSRTTSVGTLAIERFQRPICYQDAPAELLPESLRDGNPWGLTRRVDGVLSMPESG